eukprot:9037164-Pyramimonas_sp.AAC.1
MAFLLSSSFSHGLNREPPGPLVPRPCARGCKESSKGGSWRSCHCSRLQGLLAGARPRMRGARRRAPRVSVRAIL